MDPWRSTLSGSLGSRAPTWDGCRRFFTAPVGPVFAYRARDYSAPVNFISAGLKKGAAEEAELEDSDDEEKPAKQDDFPKDFGPKKLKTVAPLFQACDLSNVRGRACSPQRGSCGFLPVTAGFCEV